MDRNPKRRLPAQEPHETRQARESVEKANADRLSRERQTEGQREKQRENNREKQR
jgi:hypothetical protein